MYYIYNKLDQGDKMAELRHGKAKSMSHFLSKDRMQYLEKWEEEWKNLPNILPLSTEAMQELLETLDKQKKEKTIKIKLK